jgi:hypothetical protein
MVESLFTYIFGPEELNLLLWEWLKDRRERPLSYDDQNHYQKIVVALRETGRLMKEKCLTEFFGKS